MICTILGLWFMSNSTPALPPTCTLPKLPNAFHISRDTLLEVSELPVGHSSISVCRYGTINVNPRPSFGYCTPEGFQQRGEVNCQKDKCKIPVLRKINPISWGLTLPRGDRSVLRSKRTGKLHTVQCGKNGDIDGINDLLESKPCKLSYYVISRDGFIVNGNDKDFQAFDEQTVRFYCQNKPAQNEHHTLECLGGVFKSLYCTGMDCSYREINDNVCD